ncbi:MAG: uracil-xanthine permease [candidate division NC10 bacterium]|nr:uracil-xanthine permease [candidate division NC10 bacterium]
MATRAETSIVLPEESLPTGRMVGLGLQHVIAMFGATVLAPFLMGFDPNLAIFFSGIGTLIFMAIVRGRVPSYLGSSFAFIGPVIAAKKLGGVPAALGGIAAAAVVYFIVGALVKTKPGTRAIAALMPPPVTAAVVAVIGIGLAPVGWDMSSKGWPLALFTLAVAICVAVAARGFAKLIPVLIAIGLPNFVTPTVNLEAVSLIVPVVVMLVAENLGHVKAISAYMERDLTPDVGNTFMGDAAATFVSALGGGTGQTTYAENIGVMSITKVFSIRPLQVAAVTAILLGLVPKFGALIGTIPVPVMGGISFLLFGLIAGTSSKVISTADEDWGTLENFGVFGISVALCTAMVAKNVTLNLWGVVLDPIGASTFAAVLLNLAIVLVKKVAAGSVGKG